MRNRTVVLVSLLSCACGSVPPPKTSGDCSEQSKATPVSPIESAQTPLVPDTPCAPGQNCLPLDPCETETCAAGQCRREHQDNGTECKAVEEWVEGPTRCYAGQCLSRRICAKACFYEIVVAMKTDTDELNKKCPDRTETPSEFEECVMSQLNPNSALTKRVNRQIHDCMMLCGYPPLLSETEILEYEANGVRLH